MMNMDYKYIIRASESGDAVCGCNTLEEARRILAMYEEEDKEENIFEEDFYEIYDTEKEEIV